MSRAIVTGSSGFVGKHLIRKLGGANEIKHGHFKPEYFRNGTPIYFLSTYGNMSTHWNPYAMIQANVVDLLTVMEAIPEYVIFMSSSSVTLPIQTAYSRTKRAGEEILLANSEIKSCIVRPFSITGCGEQKKHLIPTLIHSCMEGEEMPFVPWAMHDFVDVEDVVNGLIAAADSQATGIFEFGSGKMTPNQTVLEMVEDRTGRKANVKLVKNLRSYDTGEWFCKQGNAFFKHDKKLEQSISEMVEAYKREHA